MRPCVPLALLTFLPASFASQIHLGLPPPIIVQSTTLIDALSADSNYTRLLRLLQRTRLVPALNRLNGSTLFAPTNDAIRDHQLWNAASEADDYESIADNIQEKLRQQLFYHLLNYSVATLPSNVEVLKSLHFPPFPPDPSDENPPPSPPWLPEGGGMLGGEPQRLRWAPRDNGTFVGTDHVGKKGIQIVRPMVDAGNGILVGVGGVLEPPSNLSHVVAQQPSLSYVYGLLPSKLKELLATSPQVTLFLPQNPAWDILHKIEKQYLESEFAYDDLLRILGMHSILNNTVLWSDTFNASNKVTTANGNELIIHVSGNKTKVASATLVHPDIYASNGVLHLVSELLIPPGALQLTPEKYLLALNCTTFVKLLRSAELSSLVNSTNASYTILAPRDDVIQLGGGSFPEPGSEDLARALQYHFLPGNWTAGKFRDGILIETALEETGLRGGKQVLQLGVTGTGEDREVTFGGVGVIGDPLIINNTTIYLITRPLIPPVDVLQSALPSLQFSTFLASVFSTSLADKLKAAPTTTLLIPQNAAFESLGLVTKHLLSSSSKADLENVILHHALNEVAYQDSLYNGSQKSYRTLEGSDVRVVRDNGTVLLSPSGGWNNMHGQVVSGNILTQTGVIHELSGVLLPQSVDITIDKLAIAAKGTTMAGIVVKAGMGWILNGTAPPEGSEWAEAGITGAGWTLLCPTDDSFKGVNISRLWNDNDGMRRLVSQHLIPGPREAPSSLQDKSEDPNRPLYLDSTPTYSTLLSHTSVYGDIVFRKADDNNPQLGYLVGIKGARGTDGQHDWANVLSWGRSTAGGKGGGVVLIDRLLTPYWPPWWLEYGPPVAVGVVGFSLMGGFFWLVAKIWRREVVEATYEPVGGFDREDDD